jgi:hypothetical protein
MGNSVCCDDKKVGGEFGKEAGKGAVELTGKSSS